jgi:type II secretory pathway pseudopilin PulG
MTFTTERSELALRGQRRDPRPLPRRRRDPRPLPRRRRDRGLYRGSEESRGQRGYVLVEMLISAAIAGVLVGVLVQFAIAAQGAVTVQADVADLQQRLRVATEALRHDLLAAGAGPSSGARGLSGVEGPALSRVEGPLIDVFAPILPARTGRSGADPELSFHADRISITYVPDTRSQTALLVGMAGPAAPLAIAADAPGCPADDTCGFTRGDRALVFSAEAHDVFTVAATEPSGATVSPAAALSRAYPAGSRVVGIVQRTYYFDRPGRRLMLYDGDRSDLPLVDHVVDLRFTYYLDPAAAGVRPPPAGGSSCAYAAGTPPIPLLDDLAGASPTLVPQSRLTDGPVCGQSPYRFDADLLRVRRIGVTIRLEAESAALRGSGPAFFTRGTSPGGSKYVPDLQVTFEVAPRNMAGR